MFCGTLVDKFHLAWVQLLDFHGRFLPTQPAESGAPSQTGRWLQLFYIVDIQNTNVTLISIFIFKLPIVVPNNSFIGCTMWGPPVISWFINSMKTIVKSIINHSYWSYLHQLSYLTGTQHCNKCPKNVDLQCGPPSKLAQWLPHQSWSAELAASIKTQEKVLCTGYPPVLTCGNLTVCYWKWPIYSRFTYWKWWFSIVMLVYQRVVITPWTIDIKKLYIYIICEM